MIKSLADGFGMGEVRELAAMPGGGRRRSSISIKSNKISKSVFSRVAKEELEKAYYADPITFGSINKNVQMIMASGYKIKVDPEDEKDFTEFLESLGQVGEPYTLDELLSFTLWSQMVSGYGWLEPVYNEEDTRIVDISRLDFKTMDYARNAQGEILLDDDQRPVGYIQGGGSNAFNNPIGGDEVPKEFKAEVDLSKGGIFLLPKRIALFKLYTGSDGFEAFGLIEPAYKSIVRKLNIEEAQTNSIYARGTYPLVDYVGDPTHPPTPQRLEQALDMMKKFSHERYFALPFFHKIEPVEVKQSDIVDQTIKTMRENQSASFGIPLAFATGAGESTNRATLNNQQAMTEFTLNDIITRTVETFHKFIFKPITDQRGYKSVPKLIWNKIGTEDWDEKSTRLQKWVGLGVLGPMDVRSTIIREESLPIDENSPAPRQKQEESKEETTEKTTEEPKEESEEEQKEEKSE